MNNLILDALEQTAARLPEKIAFADEQTEVSFSALVRRAQSVAAALIPLVPPRSVVGFYMDKGVETVVGFMGAGKTSVARRLARTCGISSVDMDTCLERREGKRVKEIFAEGGEDAFRAIETDVLRELASKEEPLVISCGGGVVLREENREILAESGFVVHLRVTEDEAASRISDKSSRPLFQDINAARKRCLERAPLYSGVADVEIDTAGKSVPRIAREVQRALEKEGVLCQRRK